MSLDPNNDSVIYAGWRFLDSAKNFYKSTDRGHTWRGLTTINFNNTFPSIILRVDPFNSSTLFYAFNNSVIRSTNGGTNFNTLVSNSGVIREIVFDYEDSLIYFVSSTGLYRTDRNGDGWQALTNIVFNKIKIDPQNNEVIYGGNADGVYRSVNGGLNWILYSNLFSPSRNVIGIVKNFGMDDTIIVATNKAVYKVFGDSIITDISSNNFSVPVEFKLLQNFPNPFNPNTTIRYSLPEKSFVTMKVYDVTGKEVAKLISGNMVAGNHEVIWNTGNLESGVYFCKLESGNFSKTNRMILLK